MWLDSKTFQSISDEYAESLVGQMINIKYTQTDKHTIGRITGLISFDPVFYERFKQYKQTKYMGIIIDNSEKICFNSSEIERVEVTPDDNLMDRRKFFKKAASSSLPIIVGLSITPLFTACKGYYNDPSCSGCANGCDNSCYRSCKTSCSAGCGDGCSSYCSAQCAYSCTTGCRNTCGDACSASCVTWQS
jgi:hypothetical protein